MKKKHRWYEDIDWWMGFLTGWLLIHIIEFLATK